MFRRLDSPNKKALFFILLFCLVWLAFGFMSRELYSDDDLGHFMIARYAIQHPKLLIDIWGRPLFTILYLPGAQLGLPGARFTSAVIGGFVCWFTYVYAKERGYNRAWLIPVIFGVMPRFTAMCYNLDTGLALCLVLSGALALHAKGRDLSAALVLSLAPAARPEGVLFIFIFAVIFLYEKKWKVIPFLAVGLVVWNGVGFLASGDPLWLLHNQPWTAPYPEKFGLLYYFKKFTEITGPMHAPIFLAGIFYCLKRWKERDNVLISASWLTYFSFLVIVVWLGAFSTVGLTRYFNGTTPLVALLSLAGLNWALDSSKSSDDVIVTLILVSAAIFLALNHGYGTIILIVSTGAVILLRAFKIWGVSARYASLVVFVGLLAYATNGYTQFPNPVYSPVHYTLRNAALLYRKDFPGRFTLSSDIWFCYFADKDPYDKTQNLGVTNENIRKAPKGTIILWEPHYAGGRRYGNVDLYTLFGNSNFALQYMDVDGHVIFEKVGP